MSFIVKMYSHSSPTFVMTKAFYKSYHKAFDTLDAVEKAIQDGSTSKEIENEDW